MRRYFPFASFTHPQHANVLAVAGAMFALGLGASALLRPLPRGAIPVGPALAAAPASQSNTGTPIAHRLDPGIVYPAEVIRIIDGDTF
jgi:hypothetical protein